jgi:DNA mismatch repair protein MutL
MPAILDRGAVVSTVQALAADLEGLDRGSAAEDALRRIAALTACHAAVKANDRLTHEKMRHILDELRRTAHSTVCPHGRPVMLRLTRRQIEKNFERI